jgi:hypothetical protein
MKSNYFLDAMDAKAHLLMGNEAVPNSKYHRHGLVVQKQQNVPNSVLRHVFDTIQEYSQLQQIDRHPFACKLQVMQHKAL